jgi:GNAT superfamily N-acetyltransferase
MIVTRECKGAWSFRVNLKTRRAAPRTPDGGRVAAMFGLREGQWQRLYEDFPLRIAPGQIVAVVGPSGAGKSVLLREALRRFPGARELDEARVARSGLAPVDLLRGGELGERLEMLSRCGLAEAAAMITPARLLSGGQQYRLALAEALHRELRARNPSPSEGEGRVRVPAGIHSSPLGRGPGEGDPHPRLKAEPLPQRARGSPGRGLLVADEFAATLDFTTAANLCRNIRRVITGSRLALLLATPRGELLEFLQPDKVIVKPLGRPPHVLDCWSEVLSSASHVLDSSSRVLGGEPPSLSSAASSLESSRTHLATIPRPDCRDAPVEEGTIRDYEELSEFHYLAGPPAAHARVWIVPAPRGAGDLGGPRLAAALVVSPPLPAVRGRNLATGGRYTGPDRAAALELLNREIEWISRVIVHPVYRGCGLAVRLVRHALATAGTPLVESLAAMGAVNPFFERAGMRAFPLPPDVHAARLLSAAEAAGLSPRDVAAVTPVKRILTRRTSRKAAFLRGEIELCVRRMLGDRRAARLADPPAEVCRRTARQYIYYLGRRDAAEETA